VSFEDFCRGLSVEPQTVGEIPELMRWAESSGRNRWIYRAEKLGDDLQSSLEQAVLDHDPDLSRAFEIERRIRQEFRRRARLYVQPEPRETDALEWLALMRHYGAPSRLLDWTYSLFVAFFFALARRASPGNGYVIWAVDASWIRREANRRLGESRDVDLVAQEREEHAGRFDALFGPEGRPPEALEALVYPVNPLRLNERLTIQQGVFLCPRQITRPFVDNLRALGPERSVLKAFLIPEDRRIRFLAELDRMNMNSAVLFPGLQGFAESLWTNPLCYE
jgi:hypothetical protein